MRQNDNHEHDYHGETEFVMSYEDSISDPFEWLYVDFTTLEHIASYNGFKCEQITESDAGRYLARIY